MRLYGDCGCLHSRTSSFEDRELSHETLGLFEVFVMGASVGGKPSEDLKNEEHESSLEQTPTPRNRDKVLM